MEVPATYLNHLYLPSAGPNLQSENYQLRHSRVRVSQLSEMSGQAHGPHHADQTLMSGAVQAFQVPILVHV